MDPKNRDRIKADALKWVIAMQCDRAYEILDMLFEKLRAERGDGLLHLLEESFLARIQIGVVPKWLPEGMSATGELEAVPARISATWIGEWALHRAIQALAEVVEPSGASKTMPPELYQALMVQAAHDPRGAWEDYKRWYNSRKASPRTPAQARAIVADLERSLDSLHTMYVVNRAMLDLRAQSRSLVPKVP